MKYLIVLLGLVCLATPVQAQRRIFNRGGGYQQPRVQPQANGPVVAGAARVTTAGGGTTGTVTVKYVAEKDLPDVGGENLTIGNNREFGNKWPHIIIDNTKLDYDMYSGHYMYAGTKDRALFMASGKTYILAEAVRRDLATGRVLVRQRDGKWVESDREFPDIPEGFQVPTDVHEKLKQQKPAQAPTKEYKIESGKINAPGSI